MRSAGLWFLSIAAVNCPLAGQGSGFEVLLRDGSVVAVNAITGGPDAGFELAIGNGRRSLAGGEVLAVFGPPAVEVAAPAAWLAGGDVVFGDFAGGDSAGNHLELQSPSLGRVRVAVDRLLGLANPGAPAPLRLGLPDGVDEALLVRAAVGFDTIAGTLHQFGENGVRFQPVGAAAPRWFGRADFVALRLRLAEAPPPVAGTSRLLTRTGDRLAVTNPRWLAGSLQCQLEDGAAIAVRSADVAALVLASDAVHLSDLVPETLAETGVDGDAVHTLQRDRNVLGGPLVTAGRSCAKGLGVHAQCRVSFRVPANCERFWTRVGYDDGAAALPLVPRCEVRVTVGDQVVFAQRDLSPGTPRTTGLIPVQPGDVVTLVVEPGRGRDLGDRVNWLSPVFLPAVRRP